MHLNAFSEDLKFYVTISSRYLINSSNAFRDGFYPPRKLFSGKRRMDATLIDRLMCSQRHGNMESLSKYDYILL